MKYRRRIYYSAAQRAEIWDRWQRGESMSSIGRRFERLRCRSERLSSLDGGLSAGKVPILAAVELAV